MTFFKTLLFFSVMLVWSISYSQTDSKTGDEGRYPGEVNQITSGRQLIPQHLLDQYNTAKETFNENEKLRITAEIEKYLPQEITDQSGAELHQETGPGPNPPFNPDWYTTDVTAFTGDVAYAGGFRQIDLKQGEDGWMYLAVNRRNSGQNGYISVYRSSNGGATWVSVNGVQSSLYYQSISMLVENRSANNSNPDSTRILVYYTYSSVSNFQNTVLGCVSFRRNGTAWYFNVVGSPAAGNKYEFPSACSDGQYYTTATYVHCVVREATNAGTNVGLRKFLSTNWGVSHTSQLVNTTYNDNYPSAKYGEKNGSDSIYIATERRFSGTEYGLRVVVIPEFPTNSNNYTYFVAYSANVRYEKPQLTVVQQHYSVPKKMLITCTRALNPRFHYSSNGAASWTIDQLLGPNSSCLADWTSCNSDSLTSGGQYVIMGYVSNDGDSVNVKQLNIPPTSTFTYYKRNSHISSGLAGPSTSIYKVGSIKYATFAYPGSGPTNVYYNAEQLITGINPIGGTIPDKFDLSQNYPNPFNPVTNINISMPKSGFAKLIVYDAVGKQVAVLVDGQLNAGTYKVDFNASHLSSGVYFYRLDTENFSSIKKMMLVK